MADSNDVNSVSGTEANGKPPLWIPNHWGFFLFFFFSFAQHVLHSFLLANDDCHRLSEARRQVQGHGKMNFGMCSLQAEEHQLSLCNHGLPPEATVTVGNEAPAPSRSGC